VRTLAVVLVVALGCGGHAAPDPEAAVEVPPAPGPLDAAVLLAEVERLTAPDMRGRGSFQDGGRVAAEHVAAAFAAAGLEVVRQDAGRGAVNVIGILRGDDQAVMVSAHYDHLGIGSDGAVYPGADDNASGTAVLLGLARYAASRRYRHTILFVAFGAEEAGLVGSGAYIAEPIWPLERTRAVINFDMVGRNFVEVASAREAAVAIIGLEDIPEARPVAHRAAAEVGLTLVEMPSRLLEVFAIDNRTDEWWFRRRGVPSIHFSTGMHDDYHRPSDTIDRLVPAQLERIAKTAAGLLDSLGRRE
jgi:Zn-dependent M28 family amino/carboxypeptidase